MTLALLVILKACVFALIFAIGVGSTLADATYLWRRPGLLVRSLLAMYVLVPLAIFALVRVLPVEASVKAALLVLAVSAGAPLLPRKLGSMQGSPYVFSLLVLSSLLAIVLVPAWVAFLSPQFQVAVEVSAVAVALTMAKAFLLPLALGMIFRACWPQRGDWLAGHIMKVAGLGLLVAGVVLLAINWQIFLHLGGIGMLALFCALLIALAIGHLLGGPEAEDRTALAVACATRHIGVAVLVASAFKGPKTLVLIAAYVIASAAVSIPYMKWRRATAKPPTEPIVA